MNIGIDIDDTIADSYEVIFPYAERYTIQELNRNIKSNGEKLMTHFYVEGFHSWTETESKHFWDKYYLEIMEQIRPKILAKEVIQQLKEEGNKIYLITARFPSQKFDIVDFTKKWLENYGIIYDELIVNATNKVQIAKNKEIDIFVDDSYQNCTEVSKLGIKTYMMDFIINRDFEEDGYTRVYSWPHLYQQIKKVEEKVEKEFLPIHSI